MDENIKLTLTLPETQSVITLLGNLPTSTCAFNLYMKLKNQVDEHLKEKSTLGGIGSV